MKEGVIILSSSRSQGNTFVVTKYFSSLTAYDIIDLNQYQIGHFDYDFNNQDDDFNALFKHIVKNFKTIIFATPIYWYTMSGICKVFLDRISDFLYEEKDFGRLLKGKQLGVLSCGSDNECFNGFDMPFRESANYLGMTYFGHLHTWLEEENIPEKVKNSINNYAESLKNKAEKQNC